MLPGRKKNSGKNKYRSIIFYAEAASRTRCLRVFCFAIHKKICSKCAPLQVNKKC